MTQLPYLNLGCGLTHFPSERPYMHDLVSETVYHYPLWVNVDKVTSVNADLTFDLFAYPWPLEDNSFDGALLAHIVEHIPHEIKVHENRVLPAGVTQIGDRYFNGNGERVSLQTETTRHDVLRGLQDGWYAFFSELYRVLRPGSLVYVIAPYGWSDGGITDPTHTRLLTVNTFHHSMSGGQGGTFTYMTDCNFKVAEEPRYRFTPMFRHLIPTPEDLPDDLQRKHKDMELALMTRLNVVYDFSVVLEAVKDV